MSVPLFIPACGLPEIRRIQAMTEILLTEELFNRNNPKSLFQEVLYGST